MKRTDGRPFGVIIGIAVVLIVVAMPLTAQQSDGQLLIGYARAVVKAESLKIDVAASNEDIATFESQIKARLAKAGGPLDRDLVARATKAPRNTELLDVAEAGNQTARLLQQIRDALL